MSPQYNMHIRILSCFNNDIAPSNRLPSCTMYFATYLRKLYR